MSLNSTTTSVKEKELNNYDDTGAMIYIIIVLLWYSIGIIFMLGMQMRARSETIEDSARRRTKLLIRNFRDQTNTKEILG
jgi:transposase